MIDYQFNRKQTNFLGRKTQFKAFPKSQLSFIQLLMS